MVATLLAQALMVSLQSWAPAKGGRGPHGRSGECHAAKGWFVGDSPLYHALQVVVFKCSGETVSKQLQQRLSRSGSL